MPLVQSKLYTEADCYNLPEDVRAELIDGTLIYNQALPVVCSPLPSLSNWEKTVKPLSSQT